MFGVEDADLVRDAHAVWLTLPSAGEPAEDLYALWWAAPHAPVPSQVPAPGAPPLGGRLRVAHSGSDRWLPGCRVIALGAAGAVVVATPGGFDRALSQGDYWCPGRPGLPARVGDDVVGVDRSGGYDSEGWWRTWGGGWDLTRSAPDVTRAYLSVDPGRMEEVPRRLPRALDAVGLAWTLKVGAVPGMLARPDAAVLYVRDADREPALALTCAALTDIAAPGPRVPFTRSIGPGVSWAEDPGGEESFGQVRCRLLATAFAAGGDPVRAAAASFHAAGVDPADPHLRSTS